MSREDQQLVEELVYAIMEKFKNTPLEFDNAMPKDLYSIIENKWHYCLNMEKQIRESNLAQVMPELTRGQITKANKKHGNKFSPKYRVFSILQNNIEDVVNKSTKMWKLIYGLTTIKEGEEDPFVGRNNKEEEIEKDKADTTVKEARKKDETTTTTTEEQQTDQSVKDTQLPPLSPPHDMTTPIKNIIVTDVPDNSGQNINPLTTKDLKKIVYQTTLQAQLCNNPVLVTLEEL